MKSKSDNLTIEIGRRCARRDFLRAFTLIEMIGVVAVIAVLASVLVPRVLGVLRRGNVSATAQSLGSLSSLVTEYIVRSNSLPSRLGSDTSDAATATGRFDADLLQAGLSDRLFKSPIGNQGFQSGIGCSGPSSPSGDLLARAHIRSAPGGAVSLTPSSAAISNVNFDLDRNGAGDFSSVRMIAYAYLPGVGNIEAVELNRLIDSETNSPGTLDLAGRCINSAASVSNTVTVYVFLGSY